jgi:uncharacterized protein (TIGR02271 family)
MSYSMLSQRPEADAGAYADVAGWDVRTEAGERLGRIHDVVLGDDDRARYLDVEAGGFFNPKRVLLPVEYASPDAGTCRVQLHTIGRQEFKNLPEWSGRPSDIGWLTENMIRRACGVQASEPPPMPDEPLEPVADDPAMDDAIARAQAGAEFSPGRRPHQHDAARVPVWREGGREAAERAWTEREGHVERADRERDDAPRPESRPVVQTGEMGVRTSVDTERVRMPVRRMKEDISVERRPVTDMRAEDARPIITEDEIRIPLIEEEIVVTRRAVVREEIVIRKRAVEETTEVEADLRRERVDITPRAPLGDVSRGYADDLRP